jgi:hypothetical protein
MILQQGALTLAIVFDRTFVGNVYFGNRKIKKFAEAAVSFWRDNQLPDGSFNEYYPNEHSYPSTVFSLYAVSEVCRTLGLRAEADIERAMLKSAGYLSNRKEAEAANQEIACVAALYNVYLLTRKESLLESINDKLKDLLTLQSPEGWFPEYGGPDIGYLSVSLDYLARYYTSSGDERTLPTIEKMLEFLKFFLHPDGTAGGEYGSRSTRFFLPNGLELLRHKYALAGAMADKLLENKYCWLDSIDDRYLCHFVLHSYASAIFNYQKSANTPKLPCEDRFESFFERAGLYALNTGSYYAVMNGRKGGILEVYTDKGMIFADYGYRCKDRNKCGTTNWIDENNKLVKANKTLTSSGLFHLAGTHKPTMTKHIGLRLCSLVFGGRIIPLLKKTLILSNKKIAVSFLRKVMFHPDSIEIEDHIRSPSRLSDVTAESLFPRRFVPPTSYFQRFELQDISPEQDFESVVELRIRRKIDIEEGKVILLLCERS